MRLGQSRYRNVPITFDPMHFTLPPEVFVDITDIMVPNVLPYYSISNYGRIFNKMTGCFMNPGVDTKGYLYQPLSTQSGQKNFRIHRLVMLGFCYFEGCENFVVDHKDRNRLNPTVWNLEWVTQSENMLRAFEEGTKYNNYLSPEKVHEVCKLLESGNYTMHNVAQITGVAYTAIQAIQNKRSHTDISDMYNIQQRKIGSNLTPEQVHQLCLYFESNKKVGTLDEFSKKALISIGIENPSTKVIRTAKKILTKETYTYISKDYRF